MRVVVEPVVRTADLAWEAPAKQSLVFYLLLSDDRSIAGGVAAAGIAAGCKHLGVAATDAAGAAVAVAAAGGSGPPVGTEAIGGGRWSGKILWVLVLWLMG